MGRKEEGYMMRACVIVIDSFGIGETADASGYDDVGANTALNICREIPGEKWPSLRRLGLGNASMLLGNTLPGCDAIEQPMASYGVMAEKSPGKDTTTGHWEIAGIQLDRPFTTFPATYPSFPADLVEPFEREIGREILGNKAASGTLIIEELGPEHMKTGRPIVYTSADSVFQIAAHKQVIPLDELYQMCKTARKLCDGYAVARVIARPFDGEPGSFVRTKERKDYSIDLPQPSIMEHLQKHGVRTVGVGKIGNIFAERGLDESYPDKGNNACLERTILLLHSKPAESAGRGIFIFVNLVDTDMIFGHRRDVQGYFDAVSEIDAKIPEMLKPLTEADLLIFTADHGCDPTFKGTDHTREHVPLLVYQKGREGKGRLSASGKPSLISPRAWRNTSAPPPFPTALRFCRSLSSLFAECLLVMQAAVEL